MKHHIKVKVDNDQENGLSEKKSHSEPAGKKIAIRYYILRNQKLIFGKILFSNQCCTVYKFGSVWAIQVFVSTILLKVAKLLYFTLVAFCQI